MSTSVILIISGVVCLSICGFMFYKLTPQEGKPPSRWTGTDTSGTAVALGLMALLLAGVGMLLKGLLS